LPDKKTTIHRVAAAPKRRSSLLDAVASVFSAIAEASESADEDQLDRVRAARGDVEETDVDDLVEALEEADWDHSRLDIIESFVSNPGVHLTCGDAARLLKEFDHDTNRRRAAKMLGLCVTDKHNAYKMAAAFDFTTRTRDFMS
jgi:hypothetical protein